MTASPDPDARGTLAPLIALVPWVRPHAALLVSGVIAFFVARLFEASVPMLLMVGIDRLAAGRTDVFWPAAGIAAAVVARFAVVSFARLQVRRAGQNTAFDLRNAFFARLQRQGFAFYGSYSVGDMMTRAIADIALIQRLISMGTILVVILLFATLIGFGSMLSLSVHLTLVILPSLPIVFLYTWRASTRMNAASREVQSRLSELNTQVQESLSGIRTVQALVQEANEAERFRVTAEGYAGAFMRQARITSAMGAWMPTLASVATLIILGYGGALVRSGELSVGAFTAFFMYVSMVIAPFRVAGWILNLGQRAGVAAERLTEVLDRDDEIPDPASPAATAPVLDGALQVRDLTWSHPNARTPTLHGIDLDVEPGERIAIMGPIGSGKTTLLRLLVRLYDPPSGTVQYGVADAAANGSAPRTEAAAVPLASLRRQVTLVPQDAFLFAEPIGGNISYDDPDREDDARWAAAEHAALRDTIEQLPDRLHTLVGERGVTLSGGQRQRATLARGLIRDPAVLLLDDCLSAVDALTEAHILDRLDALRGAGTTLIVTHRIAVAQTADQIIWLEDGRIVARGTHAMLMATHPPYAELAERQLATRAAATETTDARASDPLIAVPSS